MSRLLAALVLTLASAEAFGGGAKRPQAPSTTPSEPAIEYADGEGEGKGERKKRGMRSGDMLLQQRRDRAAARAFHDELEQDPDAVAAWVGWATAQARLGKCEEALEKFWPYVYTRPFKVESALLAGRCSARLGFFDDAVYFDSIAVERNPTGLRGRNALALDLDLAGDTVGRDIVIEQLLLLDRSRDASLFAQAAVAVRHGDQDTFDVVDSLWEREGRADEEMMRLRATTWLDIDDPAEALEVMGAVKKARRGAGARILIAEARRRLGEAEDALAGFEKKAFDVLAGMDADVVHARLMIDLGRLKEARAFLEPWETVRDEDVLATRWYLARATGKDAEAALLATEWGAVRRNPLRRLEYLVPVAQRLPPN